MSLTRGAGAHRPASHKTVAEEPAETVGEEIIVTARKREENL